MTDETRITRGDLVAIRGKVRNVWVDADLRRGTRMAQVELPGGGWVTVPAAALERAERADPAPSAHDASPVTGRVGDLEAVTEEAT